MLWVLVGGAGLAMAGGWFAWRRHARRQLALETGRRHERRKQREAEWSITERLFSHRRRLRLTDRSATDGRGAPADRRPVD